MVAPLSHPSQGTNVLLFGPQVLSFHEQSFSQLRSNLLNTPEHRWILDTIKELEGYWKILVKSIPRLRSVSGTKLLEDLNDWLYAGNFTPASFPLPNILLTPLVVITELTQYWRYLDMERPVGGERHDLHGITRQNTETLGFCTGLLGAIAVASSSDQAQFRQYGAVAIRLAMLIGALVDAQDASADSYGQSKSFSAAWNSPECGAEMTRILESFPEAYTSVHYDERRTTVTSSKATASSLVQALKSAGVTIAEVGLSGRYHCECYRDDIEPLIRFCDSEPAFQFPDASRLILPTRLNSGGEYITHGKLHHIALRSVLVEQSKWYQTFAAVQSARLKDDESMVIAFGPDRCVPPSLRRKLGPRLLHFADLDNAMPRLSANMLDAKPPLRFLGDSTDNEIAVVGMSCKVAGADDLEEFWNILCDGKSQHVEVPEDRFGFESTWRDNDPKKKWYGNFVRDQDAFDHKFFKKSPREMASTDPQQRIMLQVAYQAVEQSGYFQSPNNDRHVGCYIGAGCVDYEHNIACYPSNAYSATGNLKSFIAGKISHYFGWTGPGLTIDTACSASAVAVHQACKAILSGDCTAALAGGVTVMTSPHWFQNLAGASFLSPTGACKPFDAKADGYCRGDGIGAVFLKRMSSAIADGDQVLGVIGGTAVYQNQNCTAITVPNAESLSELFRNVTKQAGLDPKQISVVEAHGTGTPVGDPAEYESIRRVFGGSIRSDTLSLGSVKGLVGHTECASGVIALIKTLLMVQEGSIPPQASFDTINPTMNATPSDHIDISTSLKPWEPNFRAALINNYGASGSNASMVVTQVPKCDPLATRALPVYSSGTRHPFWFCGLDDEALRTYSARLRKFLKAKTLSAKGTSIANVAFNVSRQSNRTHNRALILSCDSDEDLERKLEKFENGDKSVSSTARPAVRPVVLCFGGQISTFVGLDPVAFKSAKILRTHLDQCNTTCRDIGLDGIYPEIFQRTPVPDTVKFQTALFAIQYSCAKSWIDCGLEVAAVVGHSFGELTALCVAGSLSLEDALSMIAKRASLIRDSWGDDKGSMMAVEANLEDVEKLLVQANESHREDDAQIACFNGPRSFTLAGPTKSIEAAGETVAQSHEFRSSIKAKKLKVSNAFHSSLTEPLLADLEQMGEDLKFEKPAIRIERATVSTPGEELTAKFPAEHMKNPVHFSQAVQRLSKRYQSCIWLEAGSNSTITTMASRALGPSSASHFFQQINITCDDSMRFLADATANLWREGLNVSFWPHHSSQTSEYVPLLLPPYQFQKSRHWMDLKKPPQVNAEPVVKPQHLEQPPKGLWSFFGYQDEEQRSVRFRVNTTIKEFEDYVSGHTIAQAAPLCPSTLQLDIAIEALGSLLPDFAVSKLQPQLKGLNNHAPMCIDTSRQVWLDAQASDADVRIWDWKMISNATQGSSATTLHVSGRIIFQGADDAQMQSDFARYERLVGHKSCLRLLEGNDVDDVIQGRNIYKTFAEIVDYGDVYRGVQKIAGKGNESAGRVVKAYTGETWLDTPLSDSFCQVAGIFVNCMTDRPDKDICISNGIDQWIRSPRLHLGDPRPEVWDVFAHHTRPSDREFLSDVFIFDSRNGTLLEMILGISYQRVPKAALGRILSKLSPGKSGSEPLKPCAPERSDAPQADAPAPAPQHTTLEISSAPDKQKVSPPDISEKVKGLLAIVSGLEPDEIKEDADLGEIGIDSLMGMELAREIETVFNCTLDMTDLAEVTNFKGLMKCIQAALGSTIDDTAAEDEPKGEKGTGILSQDSQVDGISPQLKNDTTPHINGLNPQANGTSPHTNGVTPHMNGDKDEDIPYMNGSTPHTNGVTSHKQGVTSHTNGVVPSISVSPQSSASEDLKIPSTTILEAFGESKAITDQFISEYKFGGYADNVLPRQTELCVAHIVEAFETLGCSIKTAKQGQKLERIEYLPRHKRFVEILYKMLEKEARLIDIDGAHIIRTAIAPPKKSADALLQDLIRNYPDHANDSKLTYLTGSKLAECLTGKSDGIQLIFGSEESRDMVSGLYGRSPINMVWLKQMEDFLKRLVSKLPMHEGPIKIFEMGAGTGGTTAGMAPLLASLNILVEYTFSDLSPSMVAAARKRFKGHDFMRFRVHDLEKPPAMELLHSQHIVIANNCVHATHSLTNSTKNIHSVLRPDGFLMMLEMTDTLYWVDMIFGLLEGWWLFDDGREHAVTHESLWEESMRSVGYGHVDYTEGNRPEANLQRIIIALASGPRYDRLPKPPKSPQNGTTDCAARQAAVDNYILKYTQGFAAPVRPTTLDSPRPSGECVLLTGATGSLGSHLVARFAELPHVNTVVCLNRRNSVEPALRQRQAIESRGISLSTHELSKLKCLETDTSNPETLGLPPSEYENLVHSVTHIVHNAWPMSIKRPVKGFEKQFRVMQNLIHLASDISSRRPPGSKVGFQFISSIATVGHHPLVSGEVRVPEERMTVESVLPSGYSDAKLICERMLDETLHKYPDQFRAMAVRIGQIAGSKTSGYWNPVEHLSFLIKSSQTLKVLPNFQGELSWCPVNDVAATLGDLLISETTPYPIYHIENPARQPWREVIAVLADALGVPSSNIISFEDWVHHVRQFPGSEVDNPAINLVDFLDDHFIRMSCGGLVLDTTKSKEHSKTLASEGPVGADAVRMYVRVWREMGFLHK